MTWTFSDDFEDGDLAGWSNVGPAVTNSTAAAKNGTRGMRQAPDGTNNGIASLSDTTLPDGYTYADVSFWFQQNAHTSGNSPVVTIQNRAAVNNADLYVNYSADGRMWWDIVGTDNAETAGVVVLGEWHQWRIVVGFGAASWTMRVWRDGVPQPTVTSTGQTASDIKAIHFGGFATDPNVRYYDDISVTLTTTDPAPPTVSGTATLAASGAMVAAGLVRQQATTSLAAAGGLTAAALVRVRAAAALSAAGTLTARVGGEVSSGVMSAGSGRGPGMDAAARSGPRMRGQARTGVSMGES